MKKKKQCRTNNKKFSQNEIYSFMQPNIQTSKHPSFWKGKRIFLSGHTGFKGAWLSFWLLKMGAKVTGYALRPPTKPSLFELLGLKKAMKSVIADIRDLGRLKKEMKKANPDVVIHMAAQPLVRESYKLPVKTYNTNVMGTVNVLEAVRTCKKVKVFLNVTTDKVYENRELGKSFKECEPLGGYDPYSSSKACSEIVTAAYRSSYFNPLAFKKHGVAVSTARAGNVIGGGDWASDRLIPDFVKAILSGKKILIRNPEAVRPWQYVLEPLSGYLILAEAMYKNGVKYSGSWNFGPCAGDAKSVKWIVENLCSKWGGSANYGITKGKHPHESKFLKLNCDKSRKLLKWEPRWDINEAISRVVEWTKAYEAGIDVKEVCERQIREYEG